MLAALALPAGSRAQEAQPPRTQDVQERSTSAAAADAERASLATVVEKLSPDSRKKLGEMLGADWKDGPEWANMLVDLLKSEEMKPGFGWWKPSEKKHDWSWFSAKFDSNADGHVSPEELPSGAPYQELLFSRMDRDNDGQLRLADFDYFGPRSPTVPAMMSQYLGAFLDGDSNGRISAEELQTLLTRADKDKAGFLTVEDLYGDFSRAFANLNSSGDDMPNPERLVSMFFGGELGMWEAGPKLGDEAPDFTLPTHDGSRTITLSESRGRPVILIFGSFT